MAETNATTTGIIGNALSGIFTKIATSIAILLIGLIVGRIAGKLIQRFLKDLGVNNILKKKTGMAIHLEEAIGILISYGTYLLSIILALNNIGLFDEVAAFLALIVLVIVVVFIVLATKDFIMNLAVGSYIHTKARFKPGNRLHIQNTDGEILEAGLLETVIKTRRGETLIIPNAMLLNTEYRISKNKKT